jgi:hypothetical protein
MIYVVRYTGRINPRTNLGTTQVLYGPFRSREAAEEANLFALPQSKVDASGRSCNQPKPWLLGVSYYDADEIEYKLQNPEADGMKRVVLRPASALREHTSWRGFGLSRRGYYMFLTTGKSSWLKEA